MWLIIFGLTTAATIAGMVYLAAVIGRTAFIAKLTEGKKALRFLLSMLILAVVFVALRFLLTMQSAMIAVLYAMIFFLLSGLFSFIAKRAFKKEIPFEKRALITLLLLILYLAAGYVNCLHVVRTEYDLVTEKKIAPVKIALIADSHIGTTFDAKGFERHLRTIEAEKPDILLIAGDFVDDSTGKEDMQEACRALGKTSFPYGVYYSFGNHDEGYYGSKRGYTGEELREELIKNGVKVLEDACEQAGDDLLIAGRKDGSHTDRKEIGELLREIDPDRYVIVLDHIPDDYDKEAASAADLVLSGHTHGGQLFPINRAGEWLGMNDRTYGYEKRNNTDFVVTSGISDWAILFKTGTKSEYVIINVRGQ